MLNHIRNRVVIFCLFMLPFLLIGTIAKATQGLTSTPAPSYPLLAPNGSASAPSYSFSENSNTGFWKRSALNEVVYAANGANIVDFNGASLRMNSGSCLGFSSGDPTAAAEDSCITRSGAQVFNFGNAIFNNTSATLKYTNANISGTVNNLAGTSTMGLTLKKGSGVGNYATASTTYAVVDSTNLCFTITIPTGWKLGVAVNGAIGTATGVAVANLAITDNAACGTANAGILVETTETTTAAAVLQPISLGWVITGDGASHSIAIQYKTANGADSATIANSSATLLPTMVFTLMPSN